MALGVLELLDQVLPVLRRLVAVHPRRQESARFVELLFDPPEALADLAPLDPRRRAFDRLADGGHVLTVINLAAASSGERQHDGGKRQPGQETLGHHAPG